MGLVDWFLVGDAAAALCTGTTYCISARGRTGVGRSDWGLVQGGGAVGAEANVSLSHRAPFDAYAEGPRNRQLLSQVSLVCPRAGTPRHWANPTDIPMYNSSISRPDLPLPWFVSSVMMATAKGTVNSK
jgi:hypothetical protein